MGAQMTTTRPGTEIVREAQRLMAAGQVARAIQMLEEARHGSTDPEIPLNIALARRMQGDFAGAIAAFDQVLALQPYHFLALLSKAGVLEKIGHHKEAARIYANALKIAPRDEVLLPSLKPPVEHARRVVAANNQALASHLRAAVDPLRRQFQGESLERVDESLEIFAGLKKAFVHEPLLFNFPRLPAIPFFDRALFPWFAQLEAATETIRNDAVTLIKQDWEKFHPYIQYPAGAPVNQWQALNHSPSWSTLHLWRDGKRNADICARCPATAAVLEKLPMAEQEGFAPTAMFSVLAPHTKIPPHTGSTNTRLVVHLPLILPPNCGFRVGNDVREWKMSEAWAFDDTIEHEAWNDSDQPRTILIFDVWNPLLSEAERRMVTAMMAAHKSYNAS
jgi:aspartate beta-hydroxylase